MDITPSTSIHTFSTNGISMVSASMNVMIVSSPKNRNTVTASRLTSNCHTISTPNTPPRICMNRHLGENFSKLFGFPLKIFSLFGSLSMISFARVKSTTPSKNATIQAAMLIEFINKISLLKISLLTMVDDTLCLLLTSRQRSNRDNCDLRCNSDP